MSTRSGSATTCAKPCCARGTASPGSTSDWMNAPVSSAKVSVWLATSRFQSSDGQERNATCRGATPFPAAET
ncbi:hypothetical protein [Clavibacter zhangzhiyongii]|uniref:hypothetical protein n=1 Tax=Clavibacter zhangzhiyongii TaxID=2768071 RepID=UPI0039DFC1B1